jgi:fumarate reductase flavoprotein subunit
VQRELRDAMWERAGLVRDADGLAGAAAAIARLAERLATAGVPGHLSLNGAWQEWLNLDSQLTVARLVVASALARRESRGAHFRRDFPAPAPGPPESVLVRRGDGEPSVWREPVALTRARPPAGSARPVSVEIGD